jgi:hypothetical protein
LATASPEQLTLGTGQKEQRRISQWRPKNKGAESAVVEISDAAPRDSYVLPRLLPDSDTLETNERPAETLIALQSWEGTVLEVKEDSFIVRVADVRAEHADEEIALSKDELSDFDLELLEVGAILYWTIGYRQRMGGSRERVSRMRLRRLPAWSALQLREAQSRAEDLERELDW